MYFYCSTFEIFVLMDNILIAKLISNKYIKKSFNRQKILCFSPAFSLEFVNREVLTTDHLHTASKINPTNRCV